MIASKKSGSSASPILTLPRRPPSRAWASAESRRMKGELPPRGIRIACARKPQALCRASAIAIRRLSPIPKATERCQKDASECALPRHHAGRACTIMVGLLWLAHDRACEAASWPSSSTSFYAADRLSRSQAAGSSASSLDLQRRLHRVVTVDIPGADSYDALEIRQAGREDSTASRSRRWRTRLPSDTAKLPLMLTALRLPTFANL